MRKPLSFTAVLLAMALFVAAGWRDTSAQPAKGKGGGAADIYQKDCAKCHGAKGEGLKSLETPNFQDPKWQAANSDKKLNTAIANGDGVMPAFKDKLSAAQITSLVKLIRGFAPKAAPAKK